jgi:hypothetical protein
VTTHVEIVAGFDDRSVLSSANDLKRSVERTGDETGQAWGQGFTRGADGRLRDARGRFVKIGQDLGADLGKGMSEGLDKELPRFKAGLVDAANATRAFRDEQQKLQSLMRSGAGWDDIARQSERTANAHNFARDSARDAGGAFKELENAQKALSNSSQGLMGALTDVGGALRGLSSVAMPAGIIALSAAAVELAGVAASASQALWLIPAAAGAAGAAIGTVALATYGFGDALKAAGDPKKFAEALQQLSPNAQQAALSIQQLMPAFTQLRQATSDAFFANVGPQLTELSNQFLPTIRTLTTGIAGAFNQAFSGVAQQLMTPETQSAITGFVNNVVAAFRELAPAAAPMVKAFADLAEVGSKVLPDIARGAAEAAKQFAAFIEVHSQNGDISRWLNEGLDTLKQLIPLAVELGKDFMALAPIGRAILPDIVSALKSIGDLVPIIGTALIPLGPAFGMWTTMLGPAVKLLGMAADALAFISGDAERIAKSDLLGAQIDAATRAAGGGTGVAPGINRTALPTTGGDPALGGTGGLLPLPSAAANAGGGIGRAFNPIQPGSAWQTPRGAGNTIGGSAAGAGGAGSTGLPTAPALPYDTSLPAGYANLPQTAEIVGAENSFMDARHAVAEKQARVAQLEKDNTATEADRVKANNDVINAKQQQQQAELRLQDAAANLYKKSNQQIDGYASQMGEIGAKLDQDLGISKGLPGLADNLVRFLGNLIAAPALAQLNAISNAPGQAQGGFGLIGALGAQGVFGPQYTAAGQAAARIVVAAHLPRLWDPLRSAVACTPVTLRYWRMFLQGATQRRGRPRIHIALLSPWRRHRRSRDASPCHHWRSEQLRSGLPGATSRHDRRRSWCWWRRASRSRRAWSGARRWRTRRRDCRQRGRPVFAGEYQSRTEQPARPRRWRRLGAITVADVGRRRPVSAIERTRRPRRAAPRRSAPPSSPASGSGQGGIGIAPGGSIDTALGLAAASAFPRRGQAAQTGVKLASRAIQFAGRQQPSASRASWTRSAHGRFGSREPLVVHQDPRRPRGCGTRVAEHGGQGCSGDRQRGSTGQQQMGPGHGRRHAHQRHRSNPNRSARHRPRHRVPAAAAQLPR